MHGDLRRGHMSKHVARLCPLALACPPAPAHRWLFHCTPPSRERVCRRHLWSRKLCQYYWGFLRAIGFIVTSYATNKTLTLTWDMRVEVEAGWSRMPSYCSKGEASKFLEPGAHFNMKKVVVRRGERGGGEATARARGYSEKWRHHATIQVVTYNT